MKKSKWKNPYREKGGTEFSLRGKAGVYLIKKENEIVYIGRSGTDVYKTLYRHFQSWEDSRQVRVTYNSSFDYITKYFSVRVIYCTAAQAEILEKALIVKHRPKDNPEKYEQYILDLEDKKLMKQVTDTPQEEILGKPRTDEEIGF